MAVARVFKSGGSVIFVVKSNIRKKYDIHVDDEITYVIKRVKGKHEDINEVVDNIKVRYMATSFVVRIPVDVVKMYDIELGDYIVYDILR